MYVIELGVMMLLGLVVLFMVIRRWSGASSLPK